MLPRLDDDNESSRSARSVDKRFNMRMKKASEANPGGVVPATAPGSIGKKFNMRMRKRTSDDGEGPTHPMKVS